MRLIVRLLAVSMFAALCACGEPARPPANDKVAADPDAPLGQLPDTVAPLHYRIDLSLRPTQPRYDGVVEIDLELKAAQRTVYLHGRDLKVGPVTAVLPDGATVDGTYAQVHESGVAKLSFENDLPAGKVTVRIPFEAAFGTEPDGLTAMPDSGEKYAWTQFEAISARQAFPSFDEPRFKTPFDITITARSTDAVVTNTPPIREESLPNGLKKVVFETTKPLPTYLVALMVGPYDVEEGPTIPPSKLRQTDIPLRGITVAGKGERSRYALIETPPIVRYLEDYFATPYPYPKLDLITPPNFTAGGMENAGAITYTERGILLDDGASVQQKRYFTLLHAHELAHQWFGDFVTPKWWNDIWLNESFATWMGNKAARGVWPEGEFANETVHDALGVMDTDSLSSARAIRQPIETTGDIFNAFDGLTYDKGGAVLAMFESYLGEDVFREGVRAHMRRFPYGTADVHDFMESLAQGSGKPEVVPAFETFLNQPGVPLIRTKSECQSRDLNVELQQSPYGAPNVEDKRLWSVPVCMREAGRNTAPACTMLSEKTATLTLKNKCGAVLMPNANGAGYYRFSMPRAEWQTLVAQMGKLEPSEQMAVLHSLRAAFRAGDAEAATYIAALKSAATAGPWDVLDLARDSLAEMRGNLLSKADIAAFEQLTRAWAAPSLAKIGLELKRNEAPAVALKRAALAELLVKIGRDPATTAPLAAKGAARLRAAAQSQTPEAMPAELVPVSLWAAIYTGGLPVARDAMSAIKASSDAEFRVAAIRALTAARDPKTVAEIEEFVAAGSLTVRETVRTYMSGLFDDAESRPRAWEWLRKDFKRISAPIPKDGHARFIRLTEKLCTDTAHAEIDWFFKPMADKMPGAPRMLANALETVDRCVAWRKARGGELAAGLRAP